MKLDKNLVRELMIYYEDNLDNENVINSENITIPEYTEEQINYTTQKLIEGGYLNGSKVKGYNFCLVMSLTWNGHEFIDNARDITMWDVLCAGIAPFGSVSIGVITQLLTEICKSKFHL